MGFKTVHKHLAVAPRRENSLSRFLLLIAFVEDSIALFTLEILNATKGPPIAFRFSLGTTQWGLVSVLNANTPF